MKQLSIYLTALCFVTALLFSGCGDNQQQSSAQTENQEISELPRLMIQISDSLFFTPAGHLTDGYQTPEHLDRGAVQSFIFVEPTNEWSTIRNYQSGSVLNFSLDKDLTIAARINRNQSVGEEIRNLTASILEPHEGVVTLSVEKERLTGNIDLVSSNRLFHIRYDSLSGKHYIAEIDREKLDVQEGSQPLDFD